MESDQSVPAEVHISIEQEERNKFKIQSNQLEQIGTQLRGRRQFSIFNSIILPVIVTILTTLLTAGFQYVSWTNSVRLQNATDSANKAAETYENAAAAAGKRRYATLLFIPTIRDLARRSPESQDDGSKYNISGALTDGAAKSPDISQVNNNADISLPKLNSELLKRRYESYYLQLKAWNESYDQILTDIDYNLDRPIFLHAGLKSQAIRIFWVKFKDIDCTQSITEQLDKLQLNRHSLKIQFAAIQFCFMRLNDVLSTMIKAAPRVDNVLIDKANRELGDVYTMANEFRCYAQGRIDYYRRQKTQSILSPQLVWRRLFNTAKDDAERHFLRTAERCNPENRPT